VVNRGKFEGEDVIITFERDGSGTVENVEGKITTLKISGGDENVEVKYAFGEKQILFGKPKEKFKVDIDIIINDSTFSQVHFGGTSKAAGTFLKSSSSQDSWRVTVWFVKKSDQKSAGSIVVPPKTTANGSLMYMFVDCRAVTFERNADAEDMLTGTLSLEFSSVDADGYSNFVEYYTNATTTTLADLTTTISTDIRGALTWNTTTPAWTGSYST